MRSSLKAAAVAVAIVFSAGPAHAADPATATKPAYSTADSTIGELIDNPATKAIFDKYLPGVSSNEQFDMAKAMTLRQVQAYAPDQFTDETLAKIDADLAKVPAKK
jgi:para-nitrobenzyl esterase